VVWRKGDLVSLDPAGRDEKAILAGQAGLHPNMFAVSPDGKRVAVVQAMDLRNKGDNSPVVRLYIRTVGNDGPGTEIDDIGDAATAAWSADGSELVYCAFGDAPTPKDVRTTTAVYTVATKARTPVKLPANHILTDWTRDGRHFLTMELGTEQTAPIVGLWVMNRDGSPHKKLAGSDPALAMGRFSPDGRKVLGLVLKQPEEETPKQRAERQNLGAARPRPEPVLTVFDVAGGTATPVKDVPLNASVQGYCWSPDGRRIAYVWREKHPPGTDPMTETQSHLTVGDADGANQRTILSVTGRNLAEMTLGAVDWR
jgi:dipeptidyl aminopeptidase/acylaminoacyl peptidase